MDKKERKNTHMGMGMATLNKVLMEVSDMQNFTDRAFAIGLAVSNVAVNIYPIMLQRHNRLRAYRKLSTIDDADC